MFSQELRDRLQALKNERDSGLLPEEIYVDMCRNLIREMGPPVEEEPKIPESSSIKKNTQEDVSTRIEIVKKDVDDSDKRRYNRGVDHRRSYTKEEKLIVIVLKESGMPADEVAKNCGISRSNVEKWTTEKTKIPIVEKCRNLLLNGMFNKSSINFGDTEKQKRSLFDAVIKCFPTSNSSLDPASIDLLITALNGSGTFSSAHNNHSISSLMGYPNVFAGSESDLQQFDDNELSTFADIGDFPVPHGSKFPASAATYPSGPFRSVSNASSNTSSSSSNNANANKSTKVRKPDAAAAAASSASSDDPPAKRSKLMSELLEAAGLYFNEADGTSSMNIEDYIRPHRKVEMPPPPPMELPAKVITAVDDAELFNKDRVMSLHHTQAAVSDMTMSYDSSALSDDRFSTTALTASTTSQALRPVLKNTAFLTSFRDELRGTVLDDRGDQKLTEKEQLEEDRQIMRFLGERQYKLAIPDKNRLETLTFKEL